MAIRSTATHEVAAGDGIRCWVVSSRHGVLKSATVHNAKAELDVDPIEVEAGDTIDFVVDFRDGLNSDQYLWAPKIRERRPELGPRAGTRPATSPARPSPG